MYLWLWIIVALGWLWTCGSVFAAWWKSRLGGIWTVCAIGAWTGVAGLVILFVGPFWYAVWCVLVQPG